MIFKETEDHKNNADVFSGGQYYNMWDKYALSYKLGAEMLAEKISSDNSIIDYLVYPLIFLYRQYFELRFKELLFTSQEFNEDEVEIPYHHNLTKIWQKCEERIRLIRPETDHDHLNKIKEVLYGFEKYDKDSFAFKYPTDKQGNPNLISLNSIDIPLFLDYIASSVSFLESIKGLISATIDFKDPL